MMMVTMTPKENVRMMTRMINSILNRLRGVKLTLTSEYACPTCKKVLAGIDDTHAMANFRTHYVYDHRQLAPGNISASDLRRR
jgi:hypothetical protein